ncbi:kinase-like domain-containing protein [Rhizophagus clarus]|uniref:Kinase-like domain-containing protein n=1 Tax=Rhizophagus clarus TaxID=94130 RepID=A0A8H3R3J7_9GLOM|nr:kinase-like domain-containing protein [Rhizophagus clarus]
MDKEKLNISSHINEKLSMMCKKCNCLCYAKHFEQDFKNWTSNNNDIDKFIQDTQLSNCFANNALEWIPYDRLYDIKCITISKFDKIYRAKWIDGFIYEWNNVNQNWLRNERNMFVVLKILNNPTNMTLEFINEIITVPHKVYGITQNPETKNYMIVWNEICEKCNYICNAKRFEQDFKNWASNNNDINKFIRDIQLSEHDIYKVSKALEWISYDRFYDIKCVTISKFDKVYRAKWIDKFIRGWNGVCQNWSEQNISVVLKILDTSKSIDEIITVPHKVYGITQNPETKNYMIVWNEICEKCNYICNAKRFEQDFKNWTSNNDDIDKFIQNTQLSEHDNYEVSEASEWIPYDRFYDIKCITISKFNKMYRAKWIDGYIYGWCSENQNWWRDERSTSVVLKILNNPANVTLEFINEIITVPHKIYGITQNPETKNYMIVWNEICEKCDCICNAKRFEQDFENWTSNNNDIDKFIQNTQLSEHDNYKISKALEWIPYDRFYNIKYITISKFGKIYRAKWTDGYIYEWDNKYQNWRRDERNMSVVIITLDPANATTEFIDEIIEVPHKIYGITRNPETKNYIVVWNEICEECNYICNTEHFKQNFENWTSGNSDIDKFIQNSQLSTHSINYEVFKKALEWVPYNRIYDIEYIAKSGFDKMYRAIWIDGYIDKWDSHNHKWERRRKNMFIILKILKNPSNILKTKLYLEVYGITQDPKTKNYMMVLNDKCEKCNRICKAKYFQQNFKNWSSGNNNIDKFIQDTQLSNCFANNALEWIPFDRFYDIKYIAKGGFGKVYRANWIDGCIDKLDDYDEEWIRYNQKMFVALKSLNNSKNVTLEFMNEITLHYKVNLYKCIIKLYGITQDPESKDYIMVLDYAENGNLRNYLDAHYSILSINDKINYLHSIAHGLQDIHKIELIHRDLHIAIKICQGFRPRFNIKVPQMIVHLIKRCLDANQLNRPKAQEVKQLLSQWFKESSNMKNLNIHTELQKQIKEIEKIEGNLQISDAISANLGTTYETHSEAIYFEIFSIFIFASRRFSINVNEMIRSKSKSKEKYRTKNVWCISQYWRCN